ncbi:MAG: DUF4350 domain-containing protein [Caldilineaceae bacterium]|nr:DUF4350 domain-containing protein [Caldilineaceae bacterium]
MGGRLTRDVWLALAVVGALAAIMFVGLARQTDQEPASGPPLAARSTEPDGARALLLWLDELGYTVDTGVDADFAIPDGTEIILVLEPAQPPESRDWRALDPWIEAGGTLIVAGQTLWTWPWASHFGAPVQPDAASPITSTVRVQTPLWQAPPQTSFPANTQVRHSLRVARDDAVVHAVSARGPAVIAFDQGEGRVILSTVVHPFTNAGLREEGNPEFVLNVLALAGGPGRLWYDEWHRGIRPETPAAGPGFGRWLRTSAAGRALLLAALVIFVAVALRGRSFGRPVPLPEERVRRTPLEYVTAMANLQRRARHRHAVLLDYHTRLKRTLARRFHVPATLPDVEFVARLADQDPGLDRDELARLLAALTDPHVHEDEMVRLAAAAAAWTDARPSQRKEDSHAD